MYIYIHIIYIYISYIYIYIHITHIHTYIPTYLRTYIHTDAHTHTYIHACMHASIHTYIHTYIHVYIYIYKGERLGVLPIINPKLTCNQQPIKFLTTQQVWMLLEEKQIPYNVKRATWPMAVFQRVKIEIPREP